ncbi:alanine racemase [bacterium]|nr:alanine racemase [bacterium]
MQKETHQEYLKYKRIFKGERMPLAFVDLNKFDRNVAYVASTQQNTGKTIRVHSKSIRCLDLTKRIFEKGGDLYRGVMTISVEETRYLAEAGLDDFIVAYPTVQPSDMALLTGLTQKGVRVSLMADSVEQLKIMSEAGQKAGVVLHACLEIDMAYHPLKTNIHLGVRRSPIRSPGEALALAEKSRNYPGVTIDSVMGYEGHIAGPNDNVPKQWFKNRMIRGLKKASISEFSKRRKEIIDLLRNRGFEIRVVNGGGSGSLNSTSKEEVVTEVTAGSAFYAPGLFHHYKEVSFVPSAFFAIQVVRKPAHNMVTCQGGGYTASGSVGIDKLPYPTLPRGMQLLPLEGAGEVQTPLILHEECPDLQLGDPVFFQHAKGGELSERFNEYYLIQDGCIINKVNTYRGDGFAFI